jgi:hypothetical protein
MHLRSAPGKILQSLGEFSYLTIDQIIALHYQEASRSYVRKEVNALLTAGLAMALPRPTVTYPRLFTLTGDGQRFVSRFGCVPTKRVRRSDEQDKGHNSYFVQHTIAITDVLIRAKLLSQAIPGIALHRLYVERELKRKIYVAPLGQALPAGRQDTERQQPCCLEPDASLHFVTAGNIEDFFHLEVYRTHLREERFKRKIRGYVAYIHSTLHQQLFQTPALAIAFFCATDPLAETLLRWTEEVLHDVGQEYIGERFFFRQIATAKTSPIEMYLAPVWEQPFSDTKTPLLVLE